MTARRAASAVTIWLALPRLVAIVFFGAVITACGTTTPTAKGPPLMTSAAPTSPVEGVVTHVESAGLDKVTAFTIRTNDGTILTFRIGTLENGDEFPPGHLTEHQATSEPILVSFTRDGDDLVAVRLEDAGD